MTTKKESNIESENLKKLLELGEENINLEHLMYIVELKKYVNYLAYIVSHINSFIFPSTSPFYDDKKVVIEECGVQYGKLRKYLAVEENQLLVEENRKLNTLRETIYIFKEFIKKYSCHVVFGYIFKEVIRYSQEFSII